MIIITINDLINSTQIAAALAIMAYGKDYFPHQPYLPVMLSEFEK